MKPLDNVKLTNLIVKVTGMRKIQFDLVFKSVPDISVY